MTVARSARTRGLHAEQHFEYVRHPRVGETLTFAERVGRSWQRVGRRAGRLTFTERITDFRDAAGDVIVIPLEKLVERNVAVRVKL